MPGVIVKALLAWAGLRAAPRPHDVRVHDALNADTATIAGFRRVARQAHAVASAIAADPEDAGRIGEGVARMRDLMAEVARRADR